MIEINKEVKKILGKATFSCESKGDYSVCLPHINNEEIIAQEICQLFPQPLDDKELLEVVAQEMYEIVAVELAQFIDEFKVEIRKPLVWRELSEEKKSYWCKAGAIILALLQPKIEEAKRQERERIMGIAEKHYPRIRALAEWQALKGGE